MSRAEGDVFLSAQSRVGKVLRGKWRLDRLLGVGGSAMVYAATHRNGKRGAVKLLRPDLSLDEEARRRFLREGYVANRIEHPGAVAVLDDDSAEDGSVFLVMELLDGQTLEDLLRTRSMRMSPSEVLFIADKLLDVLAAAHDKGIVHRDLKPENVFLTMRGEVKILDFGIARLHDASLGAGRATEVGSILGTPAFMPPEQALGHNAEIDARTDLWALGALMFYTLTGRLVHEGENVNKLLLAAMTRQAPPLRSVMTNATAELGGVVDRALHFDRNYRWRNARAMQSATQSAMATFPPAPPIVPVIAAPPVGATTARSGATNPPFARDVAVPRGGTRLAVVAGGLVVAVCLGFALVLLVPSRQTAGPTDAASAAAAPLPPKSAAPEAVAEPAPSAAAPSGSSALVAAEASAAASATSPNVGATKPAASTKTTKKTTTGGDPDIFSKW